MPAPKIVVTRSLPAAALDRLRVAGEVWVSPADRALTRPELHAAAAGADALLTMPGDTVDEALVDAAGPQLAIVAQFAVGYDNADVAALDRRGVPFTNTPGVLTEATADLTLALLLAVARRVGEGERLVRRRDAWGFEPTFMLGTEVHGATLGIVGLGAIGGAVGRRARAFGMQIVYHGRRRAAAAVEVELGARRVSFEDLLDSADFVSLHCPLTPATRHLIDAAALARMRPTAFLVNTARGPVVDEQALVAALDAGRLAGAALDVFEAEPHVHPGLLDRENVVLTPHIGSATAATRLAMANLAVDNILAVLRGQEPPTRVSPPARD